MLAGVQLNPLDGENGIIDATQVMAAIRPEDDHYPQTGMVCLENTHNRGGGFIYPMDKIEAIAGLCRKEELPLHLDGARLWNASVAAEITIKDYCQHFDSVSLCFSKGLGAPVGSIIAGSKSFIKRTHFYRKAYGGGMRQAGILAAAALYALEHHLPILHQDHRRAKDFATGISDIPDISVQPENVHTNIVLFDIAEQRMTAHALAEVLAKQGVHAFPFGPQRIRIVTHLEIGDDDVDYAIRTVRTALTN